MRRVIYDYELIYLESGEITFIYDGTEYHCAAGDIIFIRPGIAHSFLLDKGEISQPHIHFDITYRPQSENIPIYFKDFDHMTAAERGRIHRDYVEEYAAVPLITVSDKLGFLGCFYSIIEGGGDSIFKKALLMQLISVIISDNFPYVLEKSPHLHTVHEIKKYIDVGNGLRMSLDDFARIFF